MFEFNESRIIAGVPVTVWYDRSQGFWAVTADRDWSSVAPPTGLNHVRAKNYAIQAFRESLARSHSLCPHCSHLLSPEELKRLWASYTARLRKPFAPGSRKGIGGRPRKQPVES